MTATTVLIAGATGMVGAQLLAKLLGAADYQRVTVLGRRAPPVNDTKLEVCISDFSNLATLQSALACDDVFCCLGTTLRAAGSREAFERVDYQMVADLARFTRAAGARRFFLVSALGSSARSLSFYSRVKARAEAAVAEAGFETVHIVRPSLLLGARVESRPMEALGRRLAPMLNPLLVGPMRSARAIPAEEVAQSLLTLARRSERGLHIHTLPLGD
jgi:uncharacterized protein YbjT (DUF2867 family)